MSRTAILLYGMLREYEVCAPSLLRNVAEPNDATIHYFGPSETDAPDAAHKGSLDVFGAFTDNPKERPSVLSSVAGADLRAVYGARLKSVIQHHEPQSTFQALAAEIAPRDRWLFKLDPARMLSMFFNIGGAIQSFLASGDDAEQVIVTRPDLAFYSRIDASIVKPGEYHLPSGEGFGSWGAKHMGNARVLSYRNVDKGIYSSGGGLVDFNDQLMLLHRSDLPVLSRLYEDVCDLLRADAPAQPETLLYLVAISQGGLEMHEHPEWAYEIFRKNMPRTVSVYTSPELVRIDRHQPHAVAMRRAAPVRHWLQDMKILLRKVVRRFTR